MPYELTPKQKRYLPVKRILDIILAGCASIVLSPLMLILAIAIKLDSPGPIIFKQKRVGKDKKLFEIWKFRTMRTDTPKDIPTHMLNNPDIFITRTGRFMRKYSLDELPQLWQCVLGEVSLIGPRPALWNQYDLIAERDKYGANSITPGITGWAQINGRDELEIPVKAKFDGEYVKNLGFGMDIKCFFGTIGSVLFHDGVVEGGTGSIEEENKKNNEAIVSAEKLRREIRTGAVISGIGCIASIGCLIALWKHSISSKKTQEQQESHSLLKTLSVIAIGCTGITTVLYKRSKDRAKIYKDLCDGVSREIKPSEDNKQESDTIPKSILITGAGSYIGESVKKWLLKEPEKYIVDTLDMIDSSWRGYDFSSYDVVYHVAGIAHADVGNVTDEQEKLYYSVNTDLAVEAAKKAKTFGVKQFIFMSSMIIYSGCQETMITKDTIPKPLNFYGDSKWQADQKIRELADENFKVVILRPPMIYGKGSKGNYPELAKLAIKLPVFPEVKNKRSMLYIENLCQFVKLMIDNEESGIFFPQNGEYTNTSEMVEMIAAVKTHTIIMIPGMDLFMRIIEHFPGKIGELATKAFGDSAYEMSMSEYKENYRIYTLPWSIKLTEGN